MSQLVCFKVFGRSLFQNLQGIRCFIRYLGVSLMHGSPTLSEGNAIPGPQSQRVAVQTRRNAVTEDRSLRCNGLFSDSSSSGLNS